MLLFLFGLRSVALDSGTLVGLPEAPIRGITLENVRVIAASSQGGQAVRAAGVADGGNDGKPWVCNDVLGFSAKGVEPALSKCN